MDFTSSYGIKHIVKMQTLLRKLLGRGATTNLPDRQGMEQFKQHFDGMAGKMEFQEWFEELNRLSLEGMNIGVGEGPNATGEISALEYINSRLKRVNELTIFDVGANVGLYTLLLKDVFAEKARIYSFEPSKKTFQKLTSNVGNKTRIELHNFGFGNSETKLILHSDSDESGMASIYKRKLDHLDVSMSQNEEIEIQTLDAFCQDHKIEGIHFLKLDVEGHEMKVLEGSAKMLAACAIEFIQFEFGGCNIDSRTYFQDFYYLLKDNYNIYRIVKDGVHPVKQYKEMYEAFSTTNFLAEKK